MSKSVVNGMKAKDNLRRRAVIKRYSGVYVLALPAMVITFIFAYIPMIWLFIAFQDFDIFKGIMGSPFVGLKHIKEIFMMPAITTAIWNTLKISIASLVIVFPIPIILALLINEVRNTAFKKIVQTVSYLPYFISWISIIGIATSILSINGLINDALSAMLGEAYTRIMFLSKQNLFVPNVLILTIWKETGWNCVIFLAAITSVDMQIFESAAIDGASRFKQVWYITLPSILPTIVILLVLKLGQVFGSNFELIYGLQNPFIDYEVISTVVYKSGITQGNYSLSAALGFVQGLMALALTLAANKVGKSISSVSIW